MALDDEPIPGEGSTPPPAGGTGGSGDDPVPGEGTTPTSRGVVPGEETRDVQGGEVIPSERVRDLRETAHPGERQVDLPLSDD